MNIIQVVLLALSVGIGKPGAIPPPYDDTGSGGSDEARVLLVAMGVNHASIDSLVWEQTNERWIDDAWELAESSKRSVQGACWSTEQKVSLRDENGKLETFAYIYCFDGQAVSTLNVKSNRGIVREGTNADTAMWATPSKFLGRYIDGVGHRKLHDILLDAQDLRVRSGASEGTKYVSGYVEVGRLSLYLEVCIDILNGFRATEINFYDGLLRRPMELIRVESFQVLNGISVPSRGTDTLYFVQADDDPRWSALQKLVVPLAKGRASPDPADPAVREAYKQAILAVYGPGGVPATLIGPPHRMTVTKIVSVNSEIPHTAFKVNPPAGAVVVDFLRLKSSDGNPVSIGP